METTVCDLCSAPLSGPILRYDHKSFPCRVSICAACGLVKLNPRWSEAKYRRFYAKKYDRFYRDPGTDVGDLFATDLASKGAKMKARLSGLPLPGDVKMLDVGAGTGFSFAALPGTPRVAGHAIEASPKCRSFLESRGISLVGRDFSSDFGGGYDLIVARHVLEHALDPKALLRKGRESLGSGGHLYLVVPNAMTFNETKAASFFRHTHTYYFNMRTLLLLCAAAGLSPVRTGADGELWAVLQSAGGGGAPAGPLPEISPEAQRAMALKYAAASRLSWPRRMRRMARRLIRGAF